MMKERALLLCWHLANSSQRFLSWALSTDTCRLIIFVRWISVGGKWLSKGKLTAAEGARHVIRVWWVNTLANHDQSCEAGLKGLVE